MSTDTRLSFHVFKTLILLALVGLLWGCILEGTPTLTQTEYGTYVGSDSGEVKAFLGVRYAQPPIDALRWAPPKALNPSQGYKPAIISGAGCIQGGAPTGVFYTSEDCLYLDIWSPSKPGKYPVMVWLHGGGLMIGSGSEMQYRGENLAKEKNVIIVSVNSRLSFMGYVASPELSAESNYGGSGNQGFLDQIQALNWIQNTIHHFGGDPDNITLFGESGGAIGVCNLIASPLTEGLFQKAIMQSGSCRMLQTPQLAGGEKKGTQLFDTLGCADAESPLECARSKSTREILAALPFDDNELFLEHPDDWAYYPTLNIDGYFLPSHPIDLIQAGVKPGLKLLLGSNKDEGTMFVGLRDHFDSEQGYRDYLATFYGPLLEEFSIAYPLSDYKSAGHAAAAIAGDGFMDCPAKEMGNIMSANGHDVFMYQFVQNVNSLTTDIILEIQKGKNAAPWGTFHSAEIPYVFGLTSVLGYLNTPERQLTKERMMSYWTNFAYTGDPNSDDLPRWPLFNREKQQYIHLGNGFEISSNLKAKQCDFWLNTFFANNNW